MEVFRVHFAATRLGHNVEPANRLCVRRAQCRMWCSVRPAKLFYTARAMVNLMYHVHQDKSLPMKDNPYIELEFVLEAPIAVLAGELHSEIQYKVDNNKLRTVLIPLAKQWLERDLTTLNLDKLYSDARTIRFCELQKMFADLDAEGSFDSEKCIKDTLRHIEKTFPYFHNETLKNQFDIYNQKIINDHRRKKTRRHRMLSKIEMLNELLILFSESELYHPDCRKPLEQCRKQIATLKNIDLLCDNDINQIVEVIETELQEKVFWRPDSWSRFVEVLTPTHRIVCVLKERSKTDDLL